MVRKFRSQIQERDQNYDTNFEEVLKPTPDGSGESQRCEWADESMYMDEKGDLAHGFIDADQMEKAVDKDGDLAHESTDASQVEQTETNKSQNRTRKKKVPWNVRKRWAPKRKVKGQPKAKTPVRSEWKFRKTG